MVRSLKQIEAEPEEKYKLYRTIKEILHPTISKRNISNYKIVLEEDLNPLSIFYPKKVSNLSKVIIYVHGNAGVTSCDARYDEISSNLAKETEELVISIDYFEEDFSSMASRIYSTFCSIYSGLRKENILEENIALMSDSTASSITTYMIWKMGQDQISVGKFILFYPILSGEYYGKSQYSSIYENNRVDYGLVEKIRRYYGEDPLVDCFPLKRRKKVSYPRTLILVGGVDPLVDEARAFARKYDTVQLVVIGFAHHGIYGCLL